MYNVIENLGTYRKKDICAGWDQFIVRRKTSLIPISYDNPGYLQICSLFILQINDAAPLTNPSLSGNLVIDNLCRRSIQSADSIKAKPERSGDAKQCIPSINSEGIDAGNGRLPEVRNNIDSRQSAWNFFLFFNKVPGTKVKNGKM